MESRSSFAGGYAGASEGRAREGKRARERIEGERGEGEKGRRLER